jgi:hypothetical protein
MRRAFGDLKTYGLMKLAAQAVKLMRDLKDLKAHWTSDPIAFDEALAAMTRTLRGFRPMTALDLVAGSPELGAPLSRKSSARYRQLTPRDHWAKSANGSALRSGSRAS